ncbi:hypothetical protein PC118_g13123 [Phytophthora cactorum]|uniref:Uncharacterized protein n=1 Tax=Phytophthora cactorum TaxID=29920 RepID=A0A8T1FL09_9STRA|nr:hypothetical protein PC118_g13123 [Phytophthora cactorum]
MFPGRVPKPLLKFYRSDNMRKHFAAATARLKRTKTSAYSEISDSGTVVSGVKRARIDPDIIDYPTKRSATAETNSMLAGLDSFQLGIRVQRLVLYYRNACDVYFHELNGIVPSSKKEQLRAELMEIGAVLNSWIERVLAHKIQLQQLVNAAEFDMRITRLIDTLPGCAPASLVTNIRQAFGIPEPRALRPHPRQR